VDEGRVENVYRLQLMNATEQTRRYRVRATGLSALTVEPARDIEVGPAEARWATVAVQAGFEVAAQAGPGPHEIHFEVEQVADPTEAPGAPAVVREKSTFIVPR
jgi:polyferredoxin